MTNGFSENPWRFFAKGTLAPRVAAGLAVILFVSSSGYPLLELHENTIEETSVREKTIVFVFEIDQQEALLMIILVDS